MAKEKDGSWLTDFLDGMKSVHTGAYNFGDYLARWTGFRDWQEQSESVMYDGLTLSIEQDKANQERKFLWEALKEYELYPLYAKSLWNDAKDRPAYYFSALVTSLAVGAFLTKKGGSWELAGIKGSGLLSDAIHDVMEELRQQLGVNKDEFLKMLENDTLQDKIAENIKMCLDQVHCKEGITYVLNKDGDKGYKLENSEWKAFVSKDEKFLDKNGNFVISPQEQKTELSQEMINFAKEITKQDTLSEEFTQKLLILQNTFEISDEDVKDYILNPITTKEDLEKFEKELEAEELFEARQQERLANKDKDDDDNVRRMDD
ncbi:MAG: hypothetical protein LBL65_05980 [Campylobacteraceae bacterium]|jgi:hypothetical protein|nr:hypothetical protein [Campylobacteraceae bacterium]